MAGKSFDRVVDVYDETRGGEARGHSIAAGVLPYLRPGRTLEIGVGTGIIALGLRDRGVDVVGVDLAPAMLAKAVDRVGPCVAVADGYQLPVPDASVDNALFVWVLQTVPEIEPMLAEAARVVRPGGRVVAVPSGGVRTDPANAIVRAMHDALGVRAGARAEGVATAGHGVPALRHVATDLALHEPYASCPARDADNIERRMFSSLFDVGDEQWARVVAPAIAALRALPDAGETTLVDSHQHVVVFERIP